MNKSSLVFAVFLLAGVDAAVAVQGDLSQGYLDTNTNGSFISKSPNSVTFQGGSGSIVFGGTQTSYGASVSIPSAPSGPVVPNSAWSVVRYDKGLVATDGAMVNLLDFQANFGSQYRRVISEWYNVPLSVVPSITDYTGRLGFDPDPIVFGRVYTKFTTYGLTGGTPSRITDAWYDVVWTDNDTPGYHRVFAGGNQLTAGQTYHMSGVPFVTIQNSDNQGGASLVTVSNFGYEYEIGTAPTLTKRETYYGVSFFMAPVPEPSSYAMMIAGLMAVGAFAKRAARCKGGA